MKINEQELAEAVDRLREGEKVLDVTHEDVLSKLAERKDLIEILLDELFCVSEAQESFERCFNGVATDLLIEAYRTKLEIDAGLI